MPITMHWADEQKKVFIFDGRPSDWSWSEYDAAVDQALDIIRAVQHDVVVILLSAHTLPEGNAVTHAQRAVSLQPNNLKLYIIVGGDVFVRTLNNILMRMFHKTRIVYAATEADAFKLAAQRGYPADFQSDNASLQ